MKLIGCWLLACSVLCLKGAEQAAAPDADGLVMKESAVLERGEDEVLSLFGKPNGRMEFGTKLILLFKQATVTVQSK